MKWEMGMLNNYTKKYHSAYFDVEDGKRIYVKHEDRNFLHLKTCSISINADLLERSDCVRIFIDHLKVVL
jgi:hypothetical protein